MVSIQMIQAPTACYEYSALCCYMLRLWLLLWSCILLIETTRVNMKWENVCH